TAVARGKSRVGACRPNRPPIQDSRPLADRPRRTRTAHTRLSRQSSRTSLRIRLDSTVRANNPAGAGLLRSDGRYIDAEDFSIELVVLGPEDERGAGLQRLAFGLPAVGPPDRHQPHDAVDDDDPALLEF